MSERLGIGSDALQQFQFAAQASGASAEDASTGLRFLNRNVGLAVTGNKGAADTFTRLGISLKDAHGEVRPLSEITGDLADKMQGMGSQAERTAAATQLLGRGGAALLPMFQEGRKGIEETNEAFADLGGGMSKDFVEQAHKAEVANFKLSFAFNALKIRIAAALLPTLIQGTEKITKWIAVGIKWLKGTNAIKTALMMLTSGSILFSLKKMADLFGLSKIGIVGMLEKLSAFAGPIALILILYLLFDDLYTLFTGGDSAIGRLIDRIWGVGAAAQAVTWVKKEFQDLMDYISSPEFGETIFKIADYFVRCAKVILGVLKLIGENIGNTMSVIGDIASGDFKGAKRHYGAMLKDQLSNVDAILTAATNPAITRPPAQVSAPAFHRGADGTITTGDINIHVNGGDDPKATGEAAKKGVKSALKEAGQRSAFSAVKTGPVAE